MIKRCMFYTEMLNDQGRHRGRAAGQREPPEVRFNKLSKLR